MFCTISTPNLKPNGSITLNACRMRNIVTCDYKCTKKVWQTDRCRTKWSLCALQGYTKMKVNVHKATSLYEWQEGNWKEVLWTTWIWGKPYYRRVVVRVCSLSQNILHCEDKTRRVYVTLMPRRQQSQNMAKILKSYILTPPHPRGMWCQ